eukprot:NODE_29633_length_440_cov_5.031949.p3 GENE.NODE_29633_length_440_cov_5.031949~~NODE_29633_length_440_cov_5.031949.p3  ORF type:complete len:56 (-),score=14.60 NODE_29633_length_440_cov_5.031949:78-245(-)
MCRTSLVKASCPDISGDAAECEGVVWFNSASEQHCWEELAMERATAITMIYRLTV